MTQDAPESDDHKDTGSRLPGLMGSYSDEELIEHTVKHAKYFTVVQVTRGGFVRGGQNYDRHQVDTLEEARTKAEELYKADPARRGIIIYAVADFAGANNFSRPVENYPRSTWESKSQKAEREKKERKVARAKAREARMNLGARHFSKQDEPKAAPVVDASDEFWDSDVPMVVITEED